MKRQTLISRRRRATFGRRGFRSLALRRRATMVRSLRPLFLLALVALCGQAWAQNSAPTGALNLTPAARTATSTWDEDQRISASSTIMDADGIDTSTIAWQWEQTAVDGMLVGNDATRVDHPSVSDIPGTDATDRTFTPLQAQVGRQIRVCFSYTDMHDTPKMETVCSPATKVINISDAPTGGASTVNVPVAASSSSPHDFDLDDFPFADVEDGDTLNGIRIATLPSGTLVVTSNTDLTIDPGTNLSLAQLSDLAYYPSDGATAGTNRDSFTYMVADTGTAAAADGTTANRATTAATLTINLVANPATGMPAVAYASGITAPTEESPITASQGDIADGDGLGALSWQWSQADSNGGPYTDIMGATAAAFAPDDPQVDKFLRVCASFTDGAGNSERRCRQLDTAVANVNDPATLTLLMTGRVPLTGAPEEDGATLFLLNSALEDPDGTLRSGLTASHAWSYDNKGDGNFSNIVDDDAAFRPSQEHVGSRIRGCFRFTDDRGFMENVCVTTLPVVNTNDAPVPANNHVSVSTAADASAPYIFRPVDFTFDDDDNDMLESVTVHSLPITQGANQRNVGTMVLNGVTLTSAALPTTVTATQLRDGALTWHPDPGEEPTTLTDSFVGFATFTFNVTDDGSDGEGDKIGARTAIMNIRLTSPAQAAAIGRPDIVEITVTQNQAVESVSRQPRRGAVLRASQNTLVDPNGIDQSTLQWQWQLSASASGGFADIAGATDDNFALTQAQVGMYIRLCAAFTDHHATPKREGPVCSTARKVFEINRAPVALDSVVLVSAAATATAPYVFKASDFRFADADLGSGADEGAALASVTITELPNRGALLIDGDALMTSGSGKNNVVDVSDISELTYYQEDGDDEPMRDYARFRFTVSDGIESSAAATMRIDLGDSLRIRLRVFLEGPLR